MFKKSENINCAAELSHDGVGVTWVTDCLQLLRAQTVTLRVHGQLKPLEREQKMSGKKIYLH